MRVFDNLQRSCMDMGMARNGFDYVTKTTRKRHENDMETIRKRHGNNTRQLGGYIGIVLFTGLHTALARYNVLNVVGYNVCM